MPLVSAEQMENSRLRAELAGVTMERDILGKATAYFAKRRHLCDEALLVPISAIYAENRGA
jgi:transposase-like protein